MFYIYYNYLFLFYSETIGKILGKDIDIEHG